MKFLNSDSKGIEIVSFFLSFLAGIYLLIFAPARYLTWHALPPSPERIAQIIDTSVNTVTVRTVSTKIYSCNIYNKEECWIEVNHELFKGLPLWCFSDNYATNHTVQIERACSQSHGFGIVGTIYSLNDDGIIYVTQKGYISPAGYLVGAFFGLFCAFLVSVAKFLLLAIVSFFQTARIN